MLTPKQRVLKALRFEAVDRVPFTTYQGFAPQCAAERELRNRGMCLKRGAGVFSTIRPDVKESLHYYDEGGKHLLRILFETPVGTLSMLKEPAESTTWIHERMFKSPDDFKAIRFLIENERYEPAYEGFAAAEEAAGEDVFVHAGVGPEPLQTLVSGDFFSMEDFCIQWMDNRDEMLKLHDALARQCRKTFPIVADSPALFLHVGGNVTPEITGPKDFEKYYLPYYAEAHAALAPKGKIVCSHLDANCGNLRGLIARSKLDCIEAFSPAPMTDMTLGEARAAWPDKVLWLNFPSQVHLRPDDEVERFTVEMLNQVDRVEGILVGITENVPAHRWQGSFKAIMDGLDRHARENPRLYRS